jgi:hypothetical protein
MIHFFLYLHHIFIHGEKGDPTTKLPGFDLLSPKPDCVVLVISRIKFEPVRSISIDQGSILRSDHEPPLDQGHLRIRNTRFNRIRDKVTVAQAQKSKNYDRQNNFEFHLQPSIDSIDRDLIWLISDPIRKPL